MPPTRQCLALAVMSLLFGATEASGQESVTRTFDHSRCTPATAASTVCTPSYQVDLRPGDLLTLLVTNTYADEFTYSIAGVEKPKEVPARAAGVRKPPSDVVPVAQVHDPQFGGYVVKIRHNRDVTTRLLGDATITIAVRTLEWDVSFGSGFTVSGLVDPAFVVRDSVIAGVNGQSSRTLSKLLEDPDRKDRASLGAAAFVHVWHSKVPNLAATFGLGLQSTRGTTYFLGPSWRFGNKASLTIGAALGGVRTPPSGIQLGDSVGSANVLNNLGTRTIVRPFFSLSYAFIGGARDALTKPFLGSDSPGAKGAASGTAASTPSAPSTASAAAVTSTKGGDNQTASADGTLANPLGFTLTGDAALIASKPVTWRTSSPADVTVEPALGKTDEKGMAATTRVTVTKAGTYTVTAVVWGVGPLTADETRQLEISFTVKR